MRRKSYLLVLSVCLLVVLAGCTLPWKKKKPVVAPVSQPVVATSTATTTTDFIGSIKRFKDDSEFQAFLMQSAGDDSSDQAAATDMSAVSGEATSTVAAGETVASVHPQTKFYQTEPGTPDLFQNDGKYAYFLNYNDLYIVAAQPAAKAAVKTKITFKSRPQGILVSNNRLIVFGYDNQIYTDQTYRSFKRQGVYTYVKIFDITDINNPKQLRDLDFEGHYQTLRVAGDYLYFITTDHYAYQFGEPLRPRVLDNGQVLPEVCGLSSKCFAPDVYYFNIPYKSVELVAVTAIDIKNPAADLAGNIYLLSPKDQQLYASPANLYITYAQHLDEADIEQGVTIGLVKSRLTAADQDKIAKIQGADNFILSDSEKQAKIYNLVQSYISGLATADETALQATINQTLKQTLATKAQEVEKTVIHKIAFNGLGLQYKVSNQVPGYVLDGPALDENNNYLRVVTQRGGSWTNLATSTASNLLSNVYVLDSQLSPVGALENLAAGNNIATAQFVGGRIYLLSSQPDEPLFVVSVNNPQLPQAQGSLKTPYYATTLYPYGSDKLLGFGRDLNAEASGSLTDKGLKVSLFDVSIPSTPHELDTFSFGDQYSDSVALADPRAVMITDNSGLAVMPATLRSNDGTKLEFSGALVLDISGNKLKLRDRIDHSDSGNYSRRDFWNGVSYYDNSVKRSFLINDALYTYSNKFLKINDRRGAGTLAPLNSLDLLPNVGKDAQVVPVAAATSTVATTTPATVKPAAKAPVKATTTPAVKKK